MTHIVHALLCSAVLLLTPACDSDSSDSSAPINLEAEQMSPDAMNSGTTDLGVDDMRVVDMGAADEGPADATLADMGSDDVSEADHITACRFIINCENGCETEACLEDCSRLGGEEGARRLNLIRECLETNMCEDQDCLDRNCPDELAACGFGEEEMGSGRGCNFFFPCMSECTGGQASRQAECRQICYGLLSGEARTRFDAFDECINANRCQTEACIEENCLMEFVSCVGH